jgi:hypothetical protein
VSEEVFKTLSNSLNEAGEILRGETKEFRQFTRTRPPSAKSTNLLAVCAVSDDEDLIPGKLYRVKVLPSGNLSLKDESGETVICDPSDFIIVEFQPAVEKRIRKIFDRVVV